MSARSGMLVFTLLLAGSSALAVLERQIAPQRDAQRALVREATYAAAVFGAAAPPPGVRYARVTARGYAGDIELLVARDARGCPRGVAALRHQESAGYGAPLLGRQDLHATDGGWLRRALAACGTAAQDVHLDGTTGATITANAVARAVMSTASVQGAGATPQDGDAIHVMDPQ